MEGNDSNVAEVKYVAYCVGCRTKTELKEVEIGLMKYETRKGVQIEKAHIKGKCSECGRTATKIGKNSDLLLIHEKN